MNSQYKRFQDTPAATVDVRKRTLKDYAGQRVAVMGARMQQARTREGNEFGFVMLTLRLASDPAHIIQVPTSAHKIVEQMSALKHEHFPFTAMLLVSDEGVLHFGPDTKEGVLEKTQQEDMIEDIKRDIRQMRDMTEK